MVGKYSQLFVLLVALGAAQVRVQVQTTDSLSLVSLSVAFTSPRGHNITA
jgi:hypothetical protein